MPASTQADQPASSEPARSQASPWPDGARLAVSVVVNVEEGAELSLADGDERNESVYEAVEEVIGTRDLCMESHFQYGLHRGWPRIRDCLAERGVVATLNACGRAIEKSPWLAKEALALGHEISCHGWRWERHAGMEEAHERAVIARSVAAIEQACGVRPTGWHTRSATSIHTRRLLLEEGGFLYDSNAYDDDAPYVVKEAGQDHVVLPYAFDSNDMRFQRNGGFVFAEDFSRYCIDAFDRLYAEGGETPRMMSVGLHLRIIGKAARIKGLEQFLDHARSRPGVWFARRDEIAHAWRRHCRLPDWRPRAPLEATA
ncbi:MAG: chitin deacetylase [Rhizobiales bacterium PAR1]|nr:MAG: chitin deacetylase [Rhizobiales bacterium PAR1]